MNQRTITSALTTGGYKVISVYDIELHLLGQIESWVSFVWPERYNRYKGVTGAQLELQYSADMQALCRPDRYLWLTGSEHIVRIRSSQQSENRLIINCEDAVCILSERVTTATMSGFAVEATLRALVAEKLADWPCVELGDEWGLTDTYAAEIPPGDLLDTAEQVCQEQDIGFRLRYDQPAKKLLFELYRPLLDANARYAPQYGNLSDLSYTESLVDYKTTAIVVGADATVTVGAAGLTGAARRELYVDASGKSKGDEQSEADYLAMLRALGEQELAQHQIIRNFRFTPRDSVTIGAVVAASLPQAGIKAAARITSVTLTSQKGENSIITEIGAPVLRRKK